MMRSTLVRLGMLLSLVLTACAAPTQPAQQPAGSAPAASARPSRTAIIAVRQEASSLAAKPLQNAGSNVTPPTLFNAGLAIKDAREVPQPYLVEALPQLNTDSWRVLPDGRMETTYRLRPNLKWHDGTPLAAEDFVFAWRIYTTPELGASDPVPFNLIEEVTAPDSRTLLIRWSRPYPEAAELEATSFQALPRHILEQPFAQLSADAFAAHPYWTAEYLGLGPYRIEAYEPGAFIEAAAFDSYVRGRPKIDRIRVVYISDPNTVLANMLAEEVHIAIANSLPFSQGLLLKHEWGDRGSVLKNRVRPNSPTRRTETQLHPERVSAGSRAILDVRVRRALAHAVDKQSLNDGIFEGEALMADTLVPPHLDYFPLVDRLIAKYPYDLRRVEQLMGEAGFAKGADGFYTSPTQGRFTPEIRVLSGAQNEAIRSIMAAGLRQAGFDISEYTLPLAQSQDRQLRASFPSMASTDGGSLDGLGGAGIPTPGNRWTGSNRSSWANAEYDRLVDAWNTTLDRDARNQHMAEMARIYSEELPSTPIYYNIGITAH